MALAARFFRLGPSSTVVKLNLVAYHDEVVANTPKASEIVDLDEPAKEIVKEIGSAINTAVEQSPQVASAIERLRDAGFDLELTIRLEIGLRERGEGSESEDGSFGLELTDDDVQTLRRMKIRIDGD
jgi:hypothetical protein